MTQTNDRLDRIEAILANIAEQQDRSQAQQDRFQSRLNQNAQEFQRGLQESKQLCDSNTRGIAELREELREGFLESRQLCDSNARSIEANSQAIAEERAQRQVDRDEWGRRSLDLLRLTENNARSIEAEASTRIEEREEREEEISQLQVSQHETDQRFNVLIGEIRQLIHRLDGAD